ncbi:MAG TPA: DNA polymerase III subunit gamma/tau [Gammaproteobacteria bacterium]|nr:DNA polymerase III subunit gamma/tau [Gammaproteobacteria bacterium]
MSYQVLARKWRPRNFHEMVGQEHVLRALVNALDNDRLHHAYLFTGTRGVGKTTIARILAKSLNCDKGVTSEPCGVCSACTEIDAGRFVDLIEVDAASRTKVDETRELLENVQYAPSRGRYKVYLIDEVHMFSNHSFNALLKTLEEPPPHVKFLLATTDPQKLPVTILSRCLQFNLKRLPLDRITAHLEDILGRETIEAEAPALKLLGRAADGSMRDALSLLDQAIAYGGGAVREAEVRAMLGTLEHDHVLRLLHALAANDAAAVLAAVEQAAQQVPDFAGLLAELLTLLQQVALAQAVPEALDESLDHREAVLELAQSLAHEDVQLYYQIGLIGRRDLPLAPDARGGLEMVLLRMLAFRPAAGALPAAPAGSASATAGGPARGAAAVRAALEPQSVAPARSATPVAPAPVTDTAPVPPRPVPAESSRPAPAAGRTLCPENWCEVVATLELGGVVRELAQNCALVDVADGQVHLALEPACKQLYSKEREQRLAQALAAWLGEAVRVVVDITGPAVETPARLQARASDERQQAAVKAIAEDANVQALQEVFGAQVRSDTIRPLDA